jgi:hypothetical protein
MSASFSYPSVTGRDAGPAGPLSGQAGPQRAGACVIDWRAARRAERACCCPARPAIIAIMPPAASRPHPTDLLLCRHHYRVSQRSLADAGASVLELDGTPVDEAAWPMACAGG